jgi:hypothetical protein
MKSIYNTILIILFISVASNASACHEGDFESSGKGHHKFGKNIGILQFTENSTISVSTTTSCDFYTAFLDSEYDFIQQQVAYGHGPQLDAIAMITGCDEQVRTEFSKTLRVNYVELNGEALSRRLEIVLNREPVLLDKCLLTAQSAYS